MTKLTIEEVISELKKEAGDSEGFHSRFDDLIERKLAEYDPGFMASMKKIYEDSGEARWCA